MKSKIITFPVIFLMLFFIVGCEKLQKEVITEETPTAEEIPEEIVEGTEEETPAEEQPVEEPALPEEPELGSEETVPTAKGEEETPKEISEGAEQSSEITTTLTVTPKIVKLLEDITIKVTPNEEHGYKTTIKIYDINNENEERVKQAYISGCGNICKKEKSTTFKAEYDWKGDYCARVVDVKTNEEVGECFKVE